MKRKAVFLIIPVFGMLLAGCTVPEPVQKVKQGAVDTLKKVVHKIDDFFKDDKPTVKVTYHF